MDQPAAGPARVLQEAARTCWTGVIAGLCSLLCPGIGGILGLPLGVVALLQLRGNAALKGAGMAWVGIVAGALQLYVAGSAYLRVQEALDQGPAAVAGFLEATCRRTFEGAPVANGLRPALERGVASDSGARLVEALGDFKRVEARSGYRVRWIGGPVLEVDYELAFAKGAPASGHFTLVRERGELRVIAFAVRSPVLTRAVTAEGKATPELGIFSGPPKPAALRSFDK